MKRGVGKKFGVSLETQKNKLLSGISRDFCWDIVQGCPKKCEKKRVCVQFLAPTKASCESWQISPYLRVSLIFALDLGELGSYVLAIS